MRLGVGRTQNVVAKGPNPGGIPRARRAVGFDDAIALLLQPLGERPANQLLVVHDEDRRGLHSAGILVRSFGVGLRDQVGHRRRLVAFLGYGCDHRREQPLALIFLCLVSRRSSESS